MKRKKTKKLQVKKIIAIIVIVMIIFSIRNGIYRFLADRQTNQTRLLLDNQLVEFSNKIYVEDSGIYISEEDIQNIFDSTIYYNVGDQELITTYNKHVGVMHLNENQMVVNDSVIQIQGKLKEIDSKIYLPITDLEIVYDMEVEYAEPTNLVMMNSLSKAKKQSIAVTNTKVKRSKAIFSVTKEKVSRGDMLYILEEEGSFAKVRTEHGNIGYVKKRKISDYETIREDLQEDIAQIKVLEGHSDITKTYENVTLEANKTNVVMLEALLLNKNHQIENKVDITSEDYKNYTNWANEQNIEIISILKKNTTVSSSLATYEQRNAIIKELYEKVMQNQYKGICIDFTEIDDINSFYRFLIELTPKFKESGLKVLVKSNDLIDQEKIKDVVDAII